MIENCRDCGTDFEFSGEEAEWYQWQELNEPERCPDCRVIRRGMQDNILTCCLCGAEFCWTADEQRAARTYQGADSYQAPKYCPTCRQDFKVRQDETINCDICYNDFTFSGAAQVTYEKRGWNKPSRCPDCRKKIKDGSPIVSEIYDKNGNLVGRSYRQGNLTERYNIKGDLIGRSYHYKDRSEHFNHKGDRQGTSYRAEGRTEYYNVKGELLWRTYHHKGCAEHYNVRGEIIGRTRH
jgi:hypothetical protein